MNEMSDFVSDDKLVSSEEYDLPRLRSFGHLVLNSSSDEESDAETVIASPQAGYHEDDARDISHHGVDIPTPLNSSVAPSTSPPCLPVTSDERHLCDASDTSSLYDGHDEHDAFSFSWGAKVTETPCSDKASDGTLGECYDADDELSSADLMSTADQMKASTELPTKAFFQYKILTKPLLKMMFVSGETAEPSIETTTLIEDITREQVLEILSRGTTLAGRRGSRAISTDDLIFLIRHDKAKVSRLRTFLSWKDVRKNVKDSDDKGGADAADFAADDAAGAVAGPSDVAAKPKNKRAKVGLAWDVNSYFSIQVPERDDEEDEEEEEQNYATLQRLAAADERTKNMTREEYVFWSECRQASFTYRKSKRFREWAGFGIVTESKPNDDIVDILGFLTFEIVQTLTEEALKVKEREDHEKNRGGADTTGADSKKRKRETGLFDPPEEGRTPIEPRHIREAYRKLQACPQKSIAMLLHNGRVPAKLPLKLI
ncbi:Putative Histone acetyltransferase PCAF/SAGA [Penicillium brasilianum]|uniref:Putative Histone acetyltransferase PCAF/SAGA n=1 Tax=Penicillium brasilianum TaxID=104259 RepID=A0A0F7VBN3_PENBI|nr:Putative Histone acetyltransferase PCAF/SAGA [Penicillium brasilianum]